MSDINEKTIFVLDHTQYFSISSEDYISLDFLKGKSHSTGDAVGTQFSKSLWTCSVESAVEYCRIVWDLHKLDKLVRFIVSDTAAHIVNTWGLSTQNMSHVLNAMALVGIPPRNTIQSSDYSVIHGLRAAVEALAEPTEHQLGLLHLAAKADGVVKIPNKGRVICITSARDNTSMKSLEDIFHTVLAQHKTMAAAQPDLVDIEHCHLVILNVVPHNIDSLVSSHEKLELSPILSTEVHTISAPNISNKLTHLIMNHYDLASTTVTGIPMKEEQNANSSANYDVEILHSRSAHTSICGNEVLLPTSIKEGAEYETVTLKWCTPRGCGSSDMQPCLSQNRVTPVDVTSRPSACLINFLLNGRAVLLEMPITFRKMGGKMTSHLLSARGGEIFIHSLQITRSCLEDLPSISEGPGGRVTDYRVADFAAFIKAHRFVPLKTKQHEENFYRARDRLYRRSNYFPLTYSTSLLYNLQRNLNWVPYFLRKLTKEDMDQNDEKQLQQQIYDLFNSASRGELLTFTNIGSGRLKNAKKTDQCKLLFAELEMLMRGCATTPHHKPLLELVLSMRAACGDAPMRTDSEGGIGKSIIRATTDSPLSPPHSMDSNSSSSVAKGSKRTNNGGQKSLLDIITAQERSQSAKRVDFTGRLCTPAGQIAKLYPEFGNKEKEANGAAAPAVPPKEEVAAPKVV